MTGDEIITLKPKCATCKKELGIILLKLTGKKLGLIKGATCEKAYCLKCQPEVIL